MSLRLVASSIWLEVIGVLVNYNPRYFIRPKTKKAGQTKAFRNPRTPPQKEVAVEM